MKTIRLNSYIAKTGLCSRRKADELISRGKIKVNGRIITTLGIKVDPEKDSITYRGKELKLKMEHTYLLLHKPKGFLTTTRDERGRKTVFDLLSPSHRRKNLFPVGRLDKETTGVLILTDDGKLANTLMHPRSQIEKTYRVGIDRPFEKTHLNRMTSGIRDEGNLLKAKAVHVSEEKVLEIILTEGKKREIRRMLARLNYKVNSLKRVQYAFLTLKELEEGTYRVLTEQEIEQLKKY
jgi:23S rRNA pseudouridine2605 synthase